MTIEDLSKEYEMQADALYGKFLSAQALASLKDSDENWASKAKIYFDLSAECKRTAALLKDFYENDEEEILQIKTDRYYDPITNKQTIMKWYIDNKETNPFAYFDFLSRASCIENEDGSFEYKIDGQETHVDMYNKFINRAKFVIYDN